MVPGERFKRDTPNFVQTFYRLNYLVCVTDLVCSFSTYFATRHFWIEGWLWSLSVRFGKMRIWQRKRHDNCYSCGIFQCKDLYILFFIPYSFMFIKGFWQSSQVSFQCVTHFSTFTWKNICKYVGRIRINLINHWNTISPDDKEAALGCLKISKQQKITN